MKYTKLFGGLALVIVLVAGFASPAWAHREKRACANVISALERVASDHSAERIQQLRSAIDQVYDKKITPKPQKAWQCILDRLTVNSLAVKALDELGKKLGKSIPLPTPNGQMVYNAIVNLVTNVFGRPGPTQGCIVFYRNQLMHRGVTLEAAYNIASIVCTGQPAGLSSQALESLLEVFNLTGQKILEAVTLNAHMVSSGFDRQLSSLANGVYFYILTIRDQEGQVLRREVRKLVILR